MGNRGRPKHPDVLTPREWEVLALLRENRTNEEISEALGVTLATARFHVAEILGKLGVPSRHEAAAWQPDPEERARRPVWVFAPLLGLRGMKWNTVGASFGVLAIVAALSLVAALAWGASRTHIAPTAFGDLATICTPGPTWTPTPKDYRPTPPTWSPEGPGPVITAGIETEAAWRNKYFAEGCDIGALPQVIAGTYDGAYAGSLREAVTTADFIVVGHVTSTTFRGDLGTPSPPGRVDSPVAETVIAVDTTIKGDVAGGLTLRQMASPLPYNGGMVVVAPSDRLLLPGDNVLILARHTPGVSGDVAEFPVGKYLTTHGVIHAVGGNPCDTIDGLSVAEASRIIVDFVQRGIADQRLAKQCDYSRFDAPYGTPSPTRSG